MLNICILAKLLYLIIYENFFKSFSILENAREE